MWSINIPSLGYTAISFLCNTFGIYTGIPCMSLIYNIMYICTRSHTSDGWIKASAFRNEAKKKKNNADCAWWHHKYKNFVLFWNIDTHNYWLIFFGARTYIYIHRNPQLWNHDALELHIADKTYYIYPYVQGIYFLFCNFQRLYLSDCVCIRIRLTFFAPSPIYLYMYTWCDRHVRTI